MMKQKVKYFHKFYNTPLPDWDVDTLILGTFNPKKGPEADYYYGRITKGGKYSNHFWPSLNEYLRSINFEFSELKVGDYEAKESIMKKLNFCCLDMINYLETDVDEEKIIEKEFSDLALMRAKDNRVYNTDKIIKFINDNGVKKVISSWGKGSTVKLKEFRNELMKIQSSSPNTDFKLYSLPPFGRLSTLEMFKEPQINKNNSSQDKVKKRIFLGELIFNELYFDQ